MYNMCWCPAGCRCCNRACQHSMRDPAMTWYSPPRADMHHMHGSPHGRLTAGLAVQKAGHLHSDSTGLQHSPAHLLRSPALAGLRCARHCPPSRGRYGLEAELAGAASLAVRQPETNTLHCGIPQGEAACHLFTLSTSAVDSAGCWFPLICSKPHATSPCWLGHGFAACTAGWLAAG